MPITLPKKNAAQTALQNSVAQANDPHDRLARENELKLKLAALLSEASEVAKAEARVKDYKAKVKALGAEFAELSDLDDEETSPDKEIVLEAPGGRLVLSKRSKTRTVVDIDKVRELMGEEAFNKSVTVGLKAIDDYLTPEEKEDVLEVGYSARTASVVPNA